MEITKGSDLILVLKLTDFKDEVMRVKDCADFRLYVWTANRNNFLQFTKSDIKQEENVDKIAIPDFMVNCLESGVICYQYQYSKYDNNFEISDNYYDKSKIVVTDLYFRNTNFNEEPANPVNYQTLNYLTNKIEKIALDCENNHAQVKEWLDTEYMDKLNAEIKRSNEVDIEFHKLIKSNKEDADNKATELNDKLDKEIQRSNEVDTEIFNLIKGNADSGKETTDSINDALNAEIARSSQKDSDLENAIDTEVTRATNAETVIDTKLEGEIERAKTAEGAIRDAVENERDRAIAKETLINDSLTSEISRAKQVETDITTNLQALKTAVETEKQRSADKDTEHTNSLNQLSAKIDTEITRAKAAEKANADAIAVFGGGEEVIGSLAHGVADAKHYTDDEIAKIQANQNVALSNMATKNEVAEVDGKLTAHIAASDTKFGDIYTKSEVDTLIDNVDVTERLANYYTKSETYNKTEIDTALTAYPKKTEITAITDENGNIITEMVIDNSSADDSVEVYTKEQCDERFAKVWQGTQSEYDALTTKDSSTIYIIK